MRTIIPSTIVLLTTPLHGHPTEAVSLNQTCPTAADADLDLPGAAAAANATARLQRKRDSLDGAYGLLGLPFKTTGSNCGDPGGDEARRRPPDRPQAVRA